LKSSATEFSYRSLRPRPSLVAALLAFAQVACNRSALLGVDLDAEPDAAQGVQQWSLGDLRPLRRIDGFAKRSSGGAQPPMRDATLLEKALQLASAVANAAAFVVLVAVLWPQLPDAFRATVRAPFEDASVPRGDGW